MFILRLRKIKYVSLIFERVNLYVNLKLIRGKGMLGKMKTSKLTKKMQHGSKKSFKKSWYLKMYLSNMSLDFLNQPKKL